MYCLCEGDRRSRPHFRHFVATDVLTYFLLPPSVAATLRLSLAGVSPYVDRTFVDGKNTRGKQTKLATVLTKVGDGRGRSGTSVGLTVLDTFKPIVGRGSWNMKGFGVPAGKVIGFDGADGTPPFTVRLGSGRRRTCVSTLFSSPVSFV